MGFDHKDNAKEKSINQCRRNQKSLNHAVNIKLDSQYQNIHRHHINIK